MYRSARVRLSAAVCAVLLCACVASGLAFGEGSLEPSRIGDFGDGRPVKVAVEGDYAYCAAAGVFTVYNISVPCRPALAAVLNLPHAVSDIAISGNHAYVALESGLGIVDISDPAAPTLVSQLLIPGCYQVRHLTLAGTTVYLPWGWVDASNGLAVADVSDPNSPALVGNYSLPEQHNGYTEVVAVAGSYLCVLDSYGWNFLVYDRGSMTLVGKTRLVWDPEVDGGSWSMAVSGHYAFLGGHGLRVVDFGNPTAPASVDFVNPLTPGGTGPDTRDIAIRSNRAYYATHQGLYVVDISNPTDVSVLTGDVPHHPMDYPPYPRGCSGVALSGGGALAFLAGDFGFSAMCVLDPQSLFHLGSVPAYGSVSDIALSSRYAYVARPMGMEVFDLAGSAGPALVGWNEGGATGGLALHSGYLYAAFNDHVRTYSVCEPTLPAWTHATPPAAGGWTQVGAGQVAASGGSLYQALGCNGLHVFDLANPAEPVEIGAISSNVLCNSAVSAREGFVYVHMSNLLGGGNRVDIYDASDPADPQLAASLPVAPNCCGRGLAISEDHLFVPGLPGLDIYSLADPTAPALVGSYATADPVVDVSVRGRFAQLTLLESEGENGLLVLDISDLTAPALLGDYTGKGGGRRGFTQHMLNCSTIGASPYYVGFADGGWGLTFFAIAGCGNTQPGADVSVPLDDESVCPALNVVNATFPTVTDAGNTVARVRWYSPGGDPPADVRFANGRAEVLTTAGYEGPAEIAFTYASWAIPSGCEQAACIYWWNADAGAWEQLPTAVDTVNHRATAQASSFGWFALGYPPYQYQFLGFLPPLENHDKPFKRGSTIPIKFRITDADGNPAPNATATLVVYYLSVGTEPGEPVVVSSANGDLGNEFRYDAADDLYIFNLSTKDTSYYSYWRFEVEVTLDDGQVFSTQFSLK